MKIFSENVKHIHFLTSLELDSIILFILLIIKLVMKV